MTQVNVDLAGTDWEALRAQKLTLLRAREMRVSELHPKEIEGISGLIHFLDMVQDQAAETLGANTVFGVPPDKEVVEIVVHGGAVQDISMPDNIIVVIKEYDVPDDWEGDIRKDDSGSSYQYLEFENHNE